MPKKETMSPEMAARAKKRKEPLNTDPNERLRRKMEKALDSMNEDAS